SGGGFVFEHWNRAGRIAPSRLGDPIEAAKQLHVFGGLVGELQRLHPGEDLQKILWKRRLVGKEIDEVDRSIDVRGLSHMFQHLAERRVVEQSAIPERRILSLDAKVCHWKCWRQTSARQDMIQCQAM